MDWTSRSGNKNIILFNHLGMEFDPTTLVVVDTWNHNDFVCMNYILNEFDNTPYSVYSLIKSAKTLWKVLIKKKNKNEDVGMKKFIVNNFMDFKMVDSRTIISQVQEFQLILWYSFWSYVFERILSSSYNNWKLPPS
jgi:hypothetical protein